MNEEQQRLIALLQTAIQEAYSENRPLFSCSEGTRRGLEQAFVFRTGVYLFNLLRETGFSDLDLDSEYNKNHGHIKSTERFPKGIRPDLILHRRDSNEENKIAVEFKGWWNSKIAEDLEKLEDLTNQRGNYRYLIGVFVRLRETGAEFRYFINGQEYVERN